MKAVILLLSALIALSVAYNSTVTTPSGTVALQWTRKPSGAWVGQVNMTISPSRLPTAKFYVPLPFTHTHANGGLTRIGTKQTVQVMCDRKSLSPELQLTKSAYECSNDFGEWGLQFTSREVSTVHENKVSFEINWETLRNVSTVAPTVVSHNSTGSDCFTGGKKRSNPFFIGLLIGGICALSVAVGWFAALFCVKRRLAALQQGAYQQMQHNNAMAHQHAMQQHVQMHMQVPVLKSDL